MCNDELYRNTFTEALGMEVKDATNAVFKDTPQWDSVGHLNLIAQLEEAFGISLEADDILDFSSFRRGKAILSQKYGIRFEE